ncbi:hypothetical protein [Serratia symbiotica]|uniref:hypothetical protein n=1 Tax=Serratia symbiotica TaxID=138074 RepID=UPI00058B070E|nr:hypothetical protein [Serratia symbiotica]
MHIAIGYQLAERPVQCHPLASMTFYLALLQQPLRRRPPFALPLPLNSLSSVSSDTTATRPFDAIQRKLPLSSHPAPQRITRRFAFTERQHRSRQCADTARQRWLAGAKRGDKLV